VFGRLISAGDPPPIGCYIYAYLIAGIPRYAGKGSAGRCWFHLCYARGLNADRAAGRKRVIPGYENPRWKNTLAARLRGGAAIEVRILAEGLTAAAANAGEREWIRHIGREDLGAGPLLNLTDGGDGLTSEDAKRHHARPEVKAKVRAVTKASAARRAEDPAWAAKMQAAGARRAKDDIWRANVTTATRAAMARPEVRERLRLAALRPAAHAELRRSMLGRVQSPDWPAAQIARTRLPAADRPRGAALVRLAIEVRGYTLARDALRAAEARSLDTFRAVFAPDVRKALAGLARRRAAFSRIGA